MTDHEAANSPELASQDDLRTLFYTARAWLSIEGNGAASTEPQSQITDYYYADGTPIAEGYPFVDFIASGDSVRQVAPEAAAVLAVGDSLSVRFNQEFLSRVAPGAPLYRRQVANCLFGFDRSPEAGATDEAFFINHDRTPGRAERFTVDRLSSLPDGTDDFFRRAALTVAECQALQQIVDNLGAIKADQEGRPPAAGVAPE